MKARRACTRESALPSHQHRISALTFNFTVDQCAYAPLYTSVTEVAPIIPVLGLTTTLAIPTRFTKLANGLKFECEAPLGVSMALECTVEPDPDSGDRNDVQACVVTENATITVCILSLTRGHEFTDEGLSV